MIVSLWLFQRSVAQRCTQYRYPNGREVHALSQFWMHFVLASADQETMDAAPQQDRHKTVANYLHSTTRVPVDARQRRS